MSADPSTNGNGASPGMPMGPQLVAPKPLQEEIWMTRGVPTVSGRELVVVEVHNDAGRFVHHLTPETAQRVGKQIAEQGRTSAVAKHVIGPDGQVVL